jgi:hypothetical protein
MYARAVALLGVAVLAALLAACTSVREMDVSGVPHVTLDDPSNAEAIGKAFEEKGAVVVHLRKGDTIPLRATLDLPVARLEAGENRLRLTREVWLYMSREVARISPDGRRWADLGDLAGMEELFGFSGGTARIGFQATRDEGAAVTVALEAR